MSSPSPIPDTIPGLPHVHAHGLGEIGRTGTVVGCRLARHDMAAGDAALQRIHRPRRSTATAGRRSPETTVQAQFVRDWKVGA